MTDNMELLPPLRAGLQPRFTSRPESIPAQFRRSWRIPVLLLSLRSSWGNRASREKLLLLNYALRNPAIQEDVIQVLEGKKSPFFLQLRVDPALARALDFAAGAGLIEMLDRGRVKLTETGVAAAEKVAEASVLEVEKSFLERVRRLAPERRVQEILNWR